MYVIRIVKHRASCLPERVIGVAELSDNYCGKFVAGEAAVSAVASVVVEFDEVAPDGCNVPFEEVFPADVRLGLKCLFQCGRKHIGDIGGYIREV